MDYISQNQRLEKLARDNKFMAVSSMFIEAGFSKTLYYGIREGVRPLSLKVCSVLAKRYNCTVDWLMNGEENEKPTVNDEKIPYNKGGKCNSCEEKDRTIFELRQLVELYREKCDNLQKKLDECDCKNDKKQSKIA